MKLPIIDLTIGMILIAVVGAGVADTWADVKGDQCAKGSKVEGGNWYCQPVSAIRYTNVGTPGNYKEVTAMHHDGSCETTPHPFTGPVAPLNEEVSVHVRGPIHLTRFAVYYPSTSAQLKKAKRTEEVHSRRWGGSHRHNNHFHEKKHVISATIDGQVVSWENNWHPDLVIPKSQYAAVPTPGGQDIVSATIDGVVVSWVNNWHPESSPQAAPTPTHFDPAASPATPATPTEPAKAFDSDPVSNSPVAPGEPAAETASDKSNVNIMSNAPVLGGSDVFERIAFYDSANQTLDNLVFLGNYGGQGSGVWDYTYGGSLSYVNSKGTGGSATAQILADEIIPSGSEITIMLGRECKDLDCGYYRPGSVAYHGFDGADKIFVFEFNMPMDGKMDFEGDMPAIWLLNAKIPRTAQYGGGDCNCWTSGCGEFDVVEALHQGSHYLKSTLHTNTPGGDSDWFMRPIQGTMKLAVIFSSSTSTIHIQVLPYDTDFATTLTGDEIDGLCSAVSKNHVSLFSVSI